MKVDGKAKLLSVLSGQVETPPPVWLMRQAGRYLPEYQAVRAKAGSFWAMATTPELAAQVTLQPIERFGFDAAIIFSDILVVPDALDVAVTFEEGVGPRLSRLLDVGGLERDPGVWAAKLAPTYEALRLVRRRLEPSKALLGFAGAPWTLATYMAEGGGSPDQRAAKLWGYRDPADFAAFLDLIGDCVAQHLIAQLDAGADAVQIFDSWASGLPVQAFADWVVTPTKRVVDKVRKAKPAANIIGFPRAATLDGYAKYVSETRVDAISLDTAASMRWAVSQFGGRTVIQGNLDPIALIAGGNALEAGVADILAASRGIPFVFNLGHGILPETPPEHVAELVALVRGKR
ncbi:MAG TPA: uroporphyrinogen decarboxylase [Rhizomicrobium sp.]|nr:uroporphyrinogen decarboxylase [Rhizomicrobium sp.]